MNNARTQPPASLKRTPTVPRGGALSGATAACGPATRSTSDAPARAGHGKAVGRAGFIPLIVGALLCLTSCRTVAPLAPAAAAEARARLDTSQPVRFESAQTLLFEFRPHWWWPSVRLAALGYASVDRTTGDYAVVCLSPVGVKLFEVARANGRVRCNFTIPVPEAAGQAITADLAALFLDQTPPPSAPVSLEHDELIFRATTDRRDTEYVYSNRDGRLLRKSYYDGRHRVATIEFRDYRTAEGWAYPRVSTLENRRFHYKLTIVAQRLSLKEGRIPGRTP